MKMMEVKEKAKMLGVKPGKMKKSDLIKAIQLKEGNDACFGSGNEQCSQMECCWRSACLTC
jgi:predicted metal-binding transcription factor (methanogenesis marker protein 9)